MKTRIAIMGPLQPLNIFFKQEIDRMVKVLVAVNSILQDLKLAIEGTIIMNEVQYFVITKLIPVFGDMAFFGMLLLFPKN